MKSQMEPSGAIGPARVSVSVYIDHDIWVLIEVRNTYIHLRITSLIGLCQIFKFVHVLFKLFILTSSA